ncbi:hypothetical protein [Haloferula sp.]|uniref:hypothetical protein n=1 Tax=Haloferula sp. TaxID=2497595 RepID=UPI00329AD267
MKSFAVAALLLPTTAIADLSWEYVEKRTQQAEEILEQRPAIEAIAERERQRETTKKGPAEKEAYAALGEALAHHPSMAEVNQAEVDALKAYQSAVSGGNQFEISITQQALAKAKAARYQKAQSIPELKLAIETWQQAVIDTKATEEQEAKARTALDSIQTKLKALSEAMGR